MMKFDVVRSAHVLPTAEREAILAAPRMGSTFTDHMVTLRWSTEDGWHDAQVTALAPFSLHPAAAVLHYAQEIFEGMKAYRAADGSALLFRPLDNARRFQCSAERMAMPILPEELFLRAVEELVEIDRAWIPDGDGTLYLRPFMFADETFLGVRPASHYTFCVIATPAGSYFKGGAKPIALWVSEDYSRAAKGGTGAAKCGGNYAGSLAAQAEAARHQCDQVVFLDAAEGRLIEELGGMNIFFVMDDGSLVTPPLGTILPGITRDSVIQLARAAGHDVVERPYSFDEWRADQAAGRLAEVFVCGTAATLTSVGTIRHAKGEFAAAAQSDGPVTTALRDALIGIQRGRTADAYGWRHVVALQEPSP
jgi:branched-chain amino acid aminotransferase